MKKKNENKCKKKQKKEISPIVIRAFGAYTPTL